MQLRIRSYRRQGIARASCERLLRQKPITLPQQTSGFCASNSPIPTVKSDSYYSRVTPINFTQLICRHCCSDGHPLEVIIRGMCQRKENNHEKDHSGLGAYCHFRNYWFSPGSWLASAEIESVGQPGLLPTPG